MFMLINNIDFIAFRGKLFSFSTQYILTDFKTQHLDNCFDLCLKNEGKIIILIVCSSAFICK